MKERGIEREREQSDNNENIINKRRSKDKID